MIGGVRRHVAGPPGPGSAPHPGPGGRRQLWSVVRLAAALLVAAALLLLAPALPLSRWISLFALTLRGAGAAGIALFSIVYVLGALLMMPAGIMTLLAGYVYGPLGGLLVVLPVSVTAATLAFWIGRVVGRAVIQDRLAGWPRFALIDDAIGRNGFRIVFLLRLSPLFPFNVLNYFLGLTHVVTRDYVLASILGLLPSTFLYVYLGSAMTSASELAEGRRTRDDPMGAAVYWGGLLATVLVTIHLTRIARKALRASLEATPPAP